MNNHHIKVKMLVGYQNDSFYCIYHLLGLLFQKILQMLMQNQIHTTSKLMFHQDQFPTLKVHHTELGLNYDHD